MKVCKIAENTLFNLRINMRKLPSVKFGLLIFSLAKYSLYVIALSYLGSYFSAENQIYSKNFDESFAKTCFI